MPSRHTARRTVRRSRRMLEDLESRVLMDGVLPSYDFGTVVNFNKNELVGNGAQPSGLVMDSAGNIFGATSSGGTQGYGTIFEIAAGTAKLTTLASFTSATGFFPTGNLVIDADGNIFGAAANGGAFNRGTIFELKAGDSTITTLDSFNGTNGSYPIGGIVESDGILYGVTYGRSGNGDRAAVYTLDPAAPVIHDVAFFADNNRPDGTLAINADGDIFGTTTVGGNNSRGSIFEIAHGTNTITTLLSFDGTFGQTPVGNLILQDQGDTDITNDVLIGETERGGTHDDGELYSFTPSTGSLKVLANFDNNNGQAPVGNIMIDGAGNILGTTAIGGTHNHGTVFSYDFNNNSLTTLYSFTQNKTDPLNPTGALVEDADGNIYGGTFGGGTFQNGTLFELSPTGAPQIASHLVVIQQPQSSLAGNTFTLTVGVEDVFGRIVTSDASDVTISLTTANGATLNGTLTETADGGLATFTDLEIDQAGTYSLTISDGTFTDVVSQNFTISANAQDNPHLVFDPNPGYFTVGKTAVGPFTVLVVDNFGNVITTNHSKVTITAQTGLSGTLTAPVIAGVANFSNIKFSAAGNYTLTATDTKAKVSDPDVTGASGDVTVGTISKAAFTTLPTTPVLAGHATTFAVSLEDSSGHVVTTDSGTTVKLTVLTGPGKFFGGGNTHFDSLTATDTNGVATFGSIDFDTAGTYTFLATINGIPTVISKTFVVSPDTDTEHLVFTTEPTDKGVQTAILPAVVVTIEDQFKNVFTKDNSKVTVAAVGPGVASGTVTMNARAGVATFANLKFATAGNYTLHATDGVITAGDSDAFVIGAATHLVFTTEPVLTTVAGHTLATIKVSVEDSTGHVVVGDTSAITLALSFFIPGSGATIGGTVTENAVNGVATFSDLSMTVAGNYTMAATDGDLMPGISSFFTISPDVATHLVVFQQPEDVGAGVKMVDPATGLAKPVIVYVEDQFNNIVISNNSTVKLTPSPGSGVSNASVSANKGIATFTNFTVASAGTYTLTASDGALTTAVTDSFDVSTSAKLVFTQGPSTTAAGSAIGPALVVKIENAAGQVVTTDNSAVTISFKQPHDSGLTGTLTVNAVNGVATFTNVIPTLQGFFALTATDGNLTPATSGNFQINSTGTVTQVVFSQQPANTTVAGATIAPHVIVKLEDQFGNIVTGSNAAVTISATGPGTLTGGTNGNVTVNASQGVATFSNLVLKTAGSYTLTATALSLTGTSEPFRIVAAAPNHMVYAVQPTESTPNTVTAQVTLLDQFNNVATNVNTVVTLAINSGPSGAKLRGITTVPVVNGQGNFDDVLPDTGGNYTLKAVSPNLGQLVSAVFTVLLVV